MHEMASARQTSGSAYWGVAMNEPADDFDAHMLAAYKHYLEALRTHLAVGMCLADAIMTAKQELDERESATLYVNGNKQ